MLNIFSDRYICFFFIFLSYICTIFCLNMQKYVEHSLMSEYVKIINMQNKILIFYQSSNDLWIFIDCMHMMLLFKHLIFSIYSFKTFLNIIFYSN